MNRSQTLAKSTESTQKTLRQKLRVDDTTKAVMHRLGNIPWDVIESIPLTDEQAKHPAKIFESTMNSLENLIGEPYYLECGRAFAVNAVARNNWDRWLREAEQGQEPYFSRLRQFESVVLSMVCHFAEKVSQSEGPVGDKLADKALERMFGDSQRQLTTLAQQPAQTQVNVVFLNPYGLKPEDISLPAAELAKRIAHKSETEGVTIETDEIPDEDST